MGFLVTSHWGSWFNGYFPLGKLVSRLLPTGGEGRVFGSLLTGDVGFHGYFLKKKEKRGNISKTRRKEQRKARLNLYNYVLFTPFTISPRCGRRWVGWILPTGGEGGFYGYFPQRCWFLVTS